jgi:hypothetical protein
MDKFLNNNCEKERKEISDCISINYHLGLYAPYQCADYFKLYDKCWKKKDNN